MMLPSMPLISTPVRSPLMSGDEGNENSSSSALLLKSSPDCLLRTPSPVSPTQKNEDTFSTLRTVSHTAQLLLKSPRRSPCPDLSNITSHKKQSPLKHVTPILRKYSVHRKAKTGKKIERKQPPLLTIKRLDVESSLQRASRVPKCFSPPTPPENHEEEREDLRTPSPMHDLDVEEPIELEDDPHVGNSEGDFDPPSSPPMEMKDSEEELAALMRASSTIVVGHRSHAPGGMCPNALRKKTRHLKELESTLALLTPEEEGTREERELYLAHAYLNKVRDQLTAEGEAGEADFQQFIDILCEAETSLLTETGSAELYMRVTALFETRPELSTELLAFVQPGVAVQCGKFMEHHELTNMAELIHKVEIFFSKQPQNLRKFLTTLTALSEQPNVTEEDVKTMIMPLLRGNPLLADRFMQLLPSARPPESLMTDFEELVCEEVDSDDDDEPFETLHIPADDSKDPYGGDTCICSCHNNTDEERFKSRADHCVPCGLKFIHGKVYLQTGKALRPAKVSFLNEDMNSSIKRLSVFSTCGRNSVTRGRKRNGNSFSQDSPCLKDVSPHKFSLDESENEEFDSYRGVSEFSSPKSRYGKQKTNSKSKNSPIPKLSPSEKSDYLYCKELNIKIPSQASVSQPSPQSEDCIPLLSPTGSSSCDTAPGNNFIVECNSVEGDLLSPQEPDSTSTMVCEEAGPSETVETRLRIEGEEVKHSQEKEDLKVEHSNEEEDLVGVDEGETENVVSSDVKEEQVEEDDMAEPEPSSSQVEPSSSQVEPSSSDSNQCHPSSSTSSAPVKDTSWTRDEDKAILQAFQQGGTAHRMLTTVRRLLPERNAEQIMGRFQTLLKLLQQLSSAAREGGSNSNQQSGGDDQ